MFEQTVSASTLSLDLSLPEVRPGVDFTVQANLGNVTADAGGTVSFFAGDAPPPETCASARGPLATEPVTNGEVAPLTVLSPSTVPNGWTGPNFGYAITAVYTGDANNAQVTSDCAQVEGLPRRACGSREHSVGDVDLGRARASPIGCCSTTSR